MTSPRPTLLIAEDDSSTALVVSDLAGSLGWDVVHAPDGEQALSLYAVHEPDLVLLDYMMPVFDGFEVLDKLRKGGSQVPIIIATASTEADLILEALRLGATDFLRKPFEHLLLLRNILGRENRRHRLQRLESLACSRIISQAVEFDIENDLTVASGVTHYITRTMTDAETAYHVRLGLEELIANAIEHGNLGFTREEKTTALNTSPGQWSQLLAERAAAAPWSARRVRIVATLEGSQLEVLTQPRHPAPCFGIWTEGYGMSSRDFGGGVGSKSRVVATSLLRPGSVVWDRVGRSYSLLPVDRPPWPISSAHAEGKPD